MMLLPNMTLREVFGRSDTGTMFEQLLEQFLRNLPLQFRE